MPPKPVKKHPTLSKCYGCIHLQLEDRKWKEHVCDLHHCYVEPSFTSCEQYQKGPANE